ncbi:MAG TPA: dihydrolipoamide acetyltransferase family protein, partial [Terriglobales bacterium]|nr:dihydrolipoamide acetyltransferase family protein [Terriglobales bacterium]
GMEVSIGQLLMSIATEAGETKSGAQRKERSSAAAATAAAPPARALKAVEERTQRAETLAGEEALADYRYQPRSGFPPPAAPSIRKIARDLGIDLTRVRGSEPGGRIVLADLRNFVERLQEIAFREKPAAPPPGAPTAPAPSIDFSKWGPVRREPMSSLRRTVSQRMFQSWSTVPKINQFDDADITELLTLRKKHAPVFEKKNTHLTLTSFIIHVVARTLTRHPRVNASLDAAANEIVFKEYCHLGIAVDTESGLIVPVLRDADKKTLLQVSRELESLTERTRQRKVSLEDLQGGSFTISNQGSIGGTHFTPIIYAPQVAILGVGQGQAKPVAIGNKIAIRTLLPLCLSYDHRVLDGGDAVRFLKEVKSGLEAFEEVEIT